MAAGFMSFLRSLRGHGALPLESTACPAVMYTIGFIALAYCDMPKPYSPRSASRKCFHKTDPVFS